MIPADEAAREWWNSHWTQQDGAAIASLAALLEARERCPGHWRCPTCGFYQVRSVISAESGNVARDADASRSVCPNEGATMVPVAWAEVAEASSDAAAESRARERDLLAQVAALREGIIEASRKPLDPAIWQEPSRAHDVAQLAYGAAFVHLAPLLIRSADAATALVERVRAEEREASAVLADTVARAHSHALEQCDNETRMANAWAKSAAQGIAAAIRARSSEPHA